MTAKITPLFAVLMALLAVGAATFVLPPAVGAPSPCAGDSDRTDRDHDRLTDCLERLLTRSSEAVADSDGDGIPDALDMAPTVGRNPQTGRLELPIAVKLYELRDATKNQAGCDLQDTGHKFWDPYIGAGAIRIETLSSQVPFVKTGLTNDDHPNDRETITMETVSANVALPQNILSFNRGNLLDVPMMGLHLGLLDEDPFNPDDPVELFDGIEDTNTALSSKIPIHLDANGDPPVIGPILPIDPDEDCAGSILLRVETPLQIAQVVAAVVGSAQNLVTYDNVNSRIAGMARASSVGTGVSAIDANGKEGMAIAGNSPGTAVESVAWAADLADTDDAESTVAWECQSKRATSTVACAFEGPSLLDCYVDIWASSGCGGSAVGLGPWEAQVVEVVEACLQADSSVSSVQASTFGCEGVGATAWAYVAQAEGIVNDLLADCGYGFGSVSAAAYDVGCGEAIALVASVPGTALAMAEEALEDCGVMVSQGARATAFADCDALLDTILGSPGVALDAAREVLADCGIGTEAQAAAVGCGEALRLVLEVPGVVVDTVAQVLEDCGVSTELAHSAVINCPNVAEVIGDLSPTLLAVVRDQLEECGITTEVEAQASAVANCDFARELAAEVVALIRGGAPPGTIGVGAIDEVMERLSGSSSSSCVSLDGVLGTPTDGSVLTLPEGASYAIATLRSEAGDLLDEEMLRLGHDARSLTGSVWSLPPLQTCAQGAATLSVKVVTQTADGIATAATGSFPVALPSPEEPVTEYLVVVGDAVSPTLATTWDGDGEAFWDGLEAY